MSIDFLVIFSTSQMEELACQTGDIEETSGHPRALSSFPVFSRKACTLVVKSKQHA